MKAKIIDYLTDVCLSYTVVSVSGVVFDHFCGTQINNFNIMLMFIICIIATAVLHMHNFFSEISPLAMMFLQYIATCILCAAVVLVLSIFEGLPTLKGWLDLFRSFTIPYIILALLYYYKVFADTKKQNDIIHEIQSK